MQEEILRLLQIREPKLCVLATATQDGKPACAVMGYAVKDDLTIILSTHRGSEKCNNIRTNNNVSLVFGWNFIETNIQIKGRAELSDQSNKYKDFEKYYYSINAYTKKFKSEDTIFIIIKPTWIRRTYMSTFPAAIEEMYVKHN